MGFRNRVHIGVMLLCIICMAAETVYSQQLTPVRRTTIVTADPEASLAFYRDALGFTVEYDQRVTDSGTLQLLAPGATEGRAIALRYGDKLGGSIGLFWTPGLEPQGPCVTPAATGSVSVLLLTDDLDNVKAKLAAAGVPSAAPPVAYDQSRGPTTVHAVFDPNCVRVSIAEIANETLQESLNR